MARYKNYSYDQMVMLPISFDRQIMPGTFEEAITPHTKSIAYKGKVTACRVCELRIKCLRNANTKARQVHIFYDRTKNNGQADGLVDKMKAKIDSVIGRYIYSKRMGIIEPVFGNVKQNKGLNRFTLRGNKKVNIQWKLFAIIHNIGKLYNYGLVIA